MKRKTKGMTLVELIAVIAIMGIITWLIYSIFASSNTLFGKAHGQVKLQDELRLISTAIEEDIKASISKGVSVAGSSITVAIAGETAVSYDFSGVSSEPEEVVFGGRREGFDYIYVLVGDSSGLRKIKKFKCNPSDGSKVEVANLGNQVKSINIDTSVSPYKFSLSVEDGRGNSENMNSLITPRNNK